MKAFSSGRSASGSIAGTADFTELVSSRGVFTGVPMTGTFNANGTGRNAYQVTVSPGGGAPSTTIGFAAYVGANNTIYLVTTNANRVTTGIAVTQAAP